MSSRAAIFCLFTAGSPDVCAPSTQPCHCSPALPHKMAPEMQPLQRAQYMEPTVHLHLPCEAWGTPVSTAWPVTSQQLQDSRRGPAAFWVLGTGTQCCHQGPGGQASPSRPWSPGSPLQAPHTGFPAQAFRPRFPCPRLPSPQTSSQATAPFPLPNCSKRKKLQKA